MYALAQVLTTIDISQYRIQSRRNDFTDEERAEAWAQVDEAIKTLSDEMVQRWKDEMDTLLVYVCFHLWCQVSRYTLTVFHDAGGPVLCGSYRVQRAIIRAHVAFCARPRSCCTHADIGTALELLRQQRIRKLLPACIPGIQYSSTYPRAGMDHMA